MYVVTYDSVKCYQRNKVKEVKKEEERRKGRKKM